MPNITFAPTDYLLVGAYFFVLVGIGIWAALARKRAAKTSEAFMVAGRTLTLPAFVATLVATWYGGILGVGELSYTNGLGTWAVFGLPYYLFAVLYALFLAGRVRDASDLTIPDKLQTAHQSKAVALMGAVLLFLMITPAPYVLMLGTLFQFLFHLSPLPALLVATAITVAFVVFGGFSTDVRTNIVQFVLMFAGFGMLVFFAARQYGSPQTLWAHLPAPLTHLTGTMTIPVIVVWYFIALQTFVDPGFHQRCSAARTPQTARNGILLSVLCWAVFDSLTLFSGLYARALLPNLAAPINSYPLLSQLVLPPGAKGLFWVGMMAPIMASVLGYTFIGAITLGRDVVWRAGLSKTHDDVWWTRIGIAITAVLSVIIARALPTVVGQWYAIGSACVPGLLIPLLTAYAPPKWRATPPATLAGMAMGTGLPLFWIFWAANHGGLDTANYPLHIEPMYVGLAASLVCWTVVFFTKRAAPLP